MEHVVFYQSAQGAPAFRRLASLDDAVSFAEHLRNVEGVTEFSVFSMSPVTLSMRAYYHVEVSAGDAPAAADAAATAPPAAPPALPEPVAASSDGPPPLPPEMPPYGSSLDPTPTMSFHALEEQATAPLDQMPAAGADVPFAAAPLPPPVASPITETFVKDGPADLPPPPAEAEAAGMDPNVVDPTVEEVTPAAATGRRSMGFFARS
ncbi:MAG TPA: hypothetical protein VHE56_03710 [Mycobacteriales bacterium]|nr:hypothetical protein [Mycobacteriales bacterium]